MNIQRRKIVVTPLDEKINESMLRWYKHMQRYAVNVPVRQCETMNKVHVRRGSETKEDMKRNNYEGYDFYNI